MAHDHHTSEPFRSKKKKTNLSLKGRESLQKNERFKREKRGTHVLLRFRRGWIARLWNANATSEQLVTGHCVRQESNAERACRASALRLLAPLPLPLPRSRRAAASRAPLRPHGRARRPLLRPCTAQHSWRIFISSTLTKYRNNRRQPLRPRGAGPPAPLAPCKSPAPPLPQPLPGGLGSFLIWGQSFCLG